MSTFAPSRRGQEAPASPIRRLMPHCEFARERGARVLHLNIGQPDIPTPKRMLDAYRSFAEPVLAYGASEGQLPYRQALADYYNGLGAADAGTRLLASQVLVTVGGSEALLFAIAATCDPGDDVLVVEPFYPNYKGFSYMLAVGIRAVTTTVDEEFALPVERLKAAIGSRTRALIVSSPGNPTGAVFSAAELTAIGQVCVEYGIFFICDEVYRDFVYDGSGKAASVLAIPGLDQSAIMIDSVSKRYSACGARVGCLVTRNAQVYAAALKYAQTRLSPPVVDQLAALAALQTPDSDLAVIIENYKARRDALVAGLNALPGVSASTPAGAFYLIVQLPVQDAEAFCVFLLREFDLDGETVMLAPADGFYATPGLGRNEVRAAYVLEVPKLLRAVAILGAGLRAFAERRVVAA